MYCEYELMGKTKYLKVVSTDDEKRDRFKCKMISEADIPGMARLYYVSIDGQDIYKYNITGYTRLDDYISASCSVEDVIETLKRILKAVHIIEKYALSKKDLLLSKYSIYVNAANSDVRMIYVPLEENSDALNIKMKSLVIDILDSITVKDQRVIELISYVKTEGVLDESKLQERIDYSFQKYVPVEYINDRDVVRIKTEKKKIRKKRSKEKNLILNTGKRRFIKRWDKKESGINNSGTLINIPSF